MITVELVTQQDEEYQAVCATANRIYNEILKVSPTSFPSTYLVMFDNGLPVGGLGLWGGDGKPELLTETYCDELALARYFPNGKMPSRWQLGEMCCYYLEKPYRRQYFCTLAAVMFEYAWAIGMSSLFLIKISTIQKQADYLGTELIFLCKPDLRKYRGTPEERERWQKVYFRQEPECCLIDLQQALWAYRARRDQNPEFLPPFALGRRLAAILNAQRTRELVAAWV